MLPPVSEWVRFGSVGGAEHAYEWARGLRRHERAVGRAEWLLACHVLGPTDEYIYHGAIRPVANGVIRDGAGSSYALGYRGGTQEGER